jgi:hypothetical protein
MRQGTGNTENLQDQGIKKRRLLTSHPGGKMNIQNPGLTKELFLCIVTWIYTGKLKWPHVGQAEKKTAVGILKAYPLIPHVWEGRGGEGREGKGREGKGREGKGREGKGREL